LVYLVFILSGWFSAILSLEHSFSITQKYFITFKRNSKGFAEVAKSNRYYQSKISNHGEKKTLHFIN